MAYSFIDTLFANGDDMDPSPFWVLMALCWFVNEKKATGTTGACWPSIKKIAAKAHVSELTARKSIKVLMEKKFITAHQPPGKVRVFYVDFSRIKELAGGKDLEGVKDVSGVKDLEAEQGNNKEQNKEQNKEVLRAPAGAPQPPEMSDDEIADLLESVPQEKGERPPFEKGAHLSEKGDHPSPAPKRKRVSNVQKPESVSEQVWEDFSALRTKRRAPITETALRGIQREAEKAGISLEAALSTCCERGWQGFKADWYKRGQFDEKNASKAACQVPSNDEWDNFDTAHYA